MTRKKLLSYSVMLTFLLGGIILFSFVEKSGFSSDFKGVKSKKVVGFEEGDIIFQSSMSGQSYAIQLATNPKYSHCGILLENKKGELKVLEAIQPVTFTSIDEFIRRGDNHHYVVKRLKHKEKLITEETLKEMRKLGNSYLGKDYDIQFKWSDDEMYCSELVWKVYERTTGIELGIPQPLKSYSLENDVVKQKMEERYGKDIPWDEPMVAPSSIFEADELEIVKEGQNKL